MGKKHFVVLGLTWGDEGKGTTVEYLVKKYQSSWVIRFNGGPQAVHHVVEKDRWHDFSQFGSGTLVPSTKTFLASGMLINIIDLIHEEHELTEKGIHDAAERLFLHGHCRLITPIHQMVNRLREVKRGTKRYGSTGRGIGEAVRDYTKHEPLLFKDAFDKKKLRKKLAAIIERKSRDVQELLTKNKQAQDIYADYHPYCSADFLTEVYHRFAMAYKHKTFTRLPRDKFIIFEGAQGALLDVNYGFYPYLTKTTTTVYALPTKDVIKIGVLRAYAHRHGKGPFMTVSPEIEKHHKELHNKTNDWQGPFRLGWFDATLAKYGITLNGGVDWISLTNLDQLSNLGKIKVCTHYIYPGHLPAGWRGEQKGKISIITGIKKVPHCKTKERTEILSRCVPVYMELRGWNENIGEVKRFKDLPQAAQEYVLFLERELRTPIKLISVNPRFDGKFERS